MSRQPSTSYHPTLATLLALLICLFSATAATAERPNIVLILADDMGYGDVQALNPKSQIPTPNLDALAASGMTMLDAHSPSAVCTPTRYGLLTGQAVTSSNAPEARHHRFHLRDELAAMGAESYAAAFSTL